MISFAVFKPYLAKNDYKINRPELTAKVDRPYLIYKNSCKIN